MANLRIRAARKSYDGRQVLHGVDLEIADQEFVVIVGPSGCGKSTLLRMIAGLEDITGGEIAIEDMIVNDIDPAERGCAMVFQNYALYPHMTVRQNIGYPLKIAKLPRPDRDRRVVEAAAILGLEDYMDRRPGQLSGGQRQRVAMGRAIVREPKVFLFDEPLSNLDAKLRVQMRIQIKRLHRRLDATSIFVTHDQVEAMTLADKLVVMNGGHIEQIGTPSEVYSNPASTFVAGFLGAPAMNLIDGNVISPSTVRLDVAGGYDVTIAGSGLRTGAEIVLGLRPEDITLGNSGNGLGAIVDLIEELGGSRVAYCQIGDTEIAVVLDKNSDVRSDREVFLEIDPTLIHAFDRATGHRLKQPGVGPENELEVAAQ